MWCRLVSFFVLLFPFVRCLWGIVTLFPHSLSLCLWLFSCSFFSFLFFVSTHSLSISNGFPWICFCFFVLSCDVLSAFAVSLCSIVLVVISKVCITSNPQKKKQQTSSQKKKNIKKSAKDQKTSRFLSKKINTKKKTRNFLSFPILLSFFYAYFRAG